MNPWLGIPLTSYEGHMADEHILQLQALNAISARQLNGHPAESVMIMGVAGGNGLEHIDGQITKKVYGVDINPEYLKTCAERHAELGGVLVPLCLDICERADMLPPADLIIANLFVEYVGYTAFGAAVSRANPEWVSVVLQSAGESFVSRSPYERAFDKLETVCHSVNAEGLTEHMECIGYVRTYLSSVRLDNGKYSISWSLQGARSLCE